MKKRSIKPETIDYLMDNAAKGTLPAGRVTRIAKENLIGKKALFTLLLNRAKQRDDDRAIECIKDLMKKTKEGRGILRKLEGKDEKKPKSKKAQEDMERRERRKDFERKQKYLEKQRKEEQRGIEKEKRERKKEERVEKEQRRKQAIAEREQKKREKIQERKEKGLARQKKTEDKIAGLKFQMDSLAEEVAVERGCNVSEVAKRKPITGQQPEEVTKLYNDEIKRLKKILRPIKQSKSIKAWWDSLSKKEKKDMSERRSLAKHRWIDVSPEVRLERRIEQSFKTTKIQEKFEPHLFSSIEKLKNGMTPERIQKELILIQKIDKKNAIKVVWKAVGIVTEEMEKEEKK